MGGITPLTARERQVAVMVCQGLKKETIGNYLGISFHSVKEYTRVIMVKTNSHNMVQACSLLAYEGVISPYEDWKQARNVWSGSGVGEHPGHRNCSS